MDTTELEKRFSTEAQNLLIQMDSYLNNAKLLELALKDHSYCKTTSSTDKSKERNLQGKIVLDTLQLIEPTEVDTTQRLSELKEISARAIHIFNPTIEYGQSKKQDLETIQTVGDACPVVQKSSCNLVDANVKEEESINIDLVEQDVAAAQTNRRLASESSKRTIEDQVIKECLQTILDQVDSFEDQRTTNIAHLASDIIGKPFADRVKNLNDAELEKHFSTEAKNLLSQMDSYLKTSKLRICRPKEKEMQKTIVLEILQLIELTEIDTIKRLSELEMISARAQHLFNTPTSKRQANRKTSANFGKTSNNKNELLTKTVCPVNQNISSTLAADAEVKEEEPIDIGLEEHHIAAIQTHSCLAPERSTTARENLVIRECLQTKLDRILLFEHQEPTYTTYPSKNIICQPPTTIEEHVDTTELEERFSTEAKNLLSQMDSYLKNATSLELTLKDHSYCTTVNLTIKSRQRKLQKKIVLKILQLIEQTDITIIQRLSELEKICARAIHLINSTNSYRIPNRQDLENVEEILNNNCRQPVRDVNSSAQCTSSSSAAAGVKDEESEALDVHKITVTNISRHSVLPESPQVNSEELLTLLDQTESLEPQGTTNTSNLSNENKRQSVSSTDNRVNDVQLEQYDSVGDEVDMRVLLDELICSIEIGNNAQTSCSKLYAVVDLDLPYAHLQNSMDDVDLRNNEDECVMDIVHSLVDKSISNDVNISVSLIFESQNTETETSNVIFDDENPMADSMLNFFRTRSPNLTLLETQITAPAFAENTGDLLSDCGPCSPIIEAESIDLNVEHAEEDHEITQGQSHDLSIERDISDDHMPEFNENNVSNNKTAHTVVLPESNSLPLQDDAQSSSSESVSPNSTALSFCEAIVMALLNSPNEMATVEMIKNFISYHFSSVFAGVDNELKVIGALKSSTWFQITYHPGYRKFYYNIDKKVRATLISNIKKLILSETTLSSSSQKENADFLTQMLNGEVGLFQEDSCDVPSENSSPVQTINPLYKFKHVHIATLAILNCPNETATTKMIYHFVRCCFPKQVSTKGMWKCLQLALIKHRNEIFQEKYLPNENEVWWTLNQLHKETAMQDVRDVISKHEKLRLIPKIDRDFVTQMVNGKVGLSAKELTDDRKDILTEVHLAFQNWEMSALALLNSSREVATLEKVWDFVEHNFPTFTTSVFWKKRIGGAINRHPAFKRKYNQWHIDPQHREKLINDLKFTISTNLFEKEVAERLNKMVRCEFVMLTEKTIGRKVLILPYKSQFPNDHDKTTTITTAIMIASKKSTHPNNGSHNSKNGNHEKSNVASSSRQIATRKKVNTTARKQKLVEVIELSDDSLDVEEESVPGEIEIIEDPPPPKKRKMTKGASLA